MTNLPAARKQGGALASRLGSNISGASLMVAMLESRTVQIQPGLRKFRPGCEPSGDERGALSRSIQDINAALEVFTDLDHLRECDEQLASVRIATKNIDGRRAVAGWLLILGDLPKAALSEAVLRIMRNEAPGVPERFMPTLDVIARVARSVVAEWTLTRDRAERMLRTETAVAITNEPVSADRLRELRDRIRATASDLRANPTSRTSTSPAARVAAELAARREQGSDAPAG